MKLFHMPVEITSLYIFNTCLFIISVLLWFNFLLLVYKKNKYKFFLAIVGVLTYIFVPETLHSMGLVYWHQSIMQVTLLVQLILYLKMQDCDAKWIKYGFYLVTILNPYIEWTGYVANIGYAIVEFFYNWNKNKKLAFKKTFIIGMLTLLSFILFAGHYLLRVDCKTFFMMLKNRFLARNFATSIPIATLIGKYYESFKLLWLLIAILMGLVLLKNEKLEIKNGNIFFVLLFMLLENFIMKEHAVAYTYDRLKLIFALSLFICELCRNILKNVQWKKICQALLLILIAIISLLNFKFYTKSNLFWKIDYFDNNQIIANYVNHEYPTAIVILPNNPVRGYINVLFDRGIYEFVSFDRAKEIAVQQNRDYVIELVIEENNINNNQQIYNILKAKIYNIKLNNMQEIFVEDNKINFLNNN